MLKQDVIEIYSLRANDAKEIAKKILEERGKKNIHIGNAIPTQLEGDKGYQVEVSYEENILEQNCDIEKMQYTYNKVNKISQEIEILNKQKELLNQEIKKIQQNCNHKIGLKVRKRQGRNLWDEAYCLNCNIHFNTPFINIDTEFQYLIHFETGFIEEKELTTEEKSQIVLCRFREIREENPFLSDKEIVDQINQEIKLQSYHNISKPSKKRKLEKNLSHD